jgi:hypothetical protein
MEKSYRNALLLGVVPSFVLFVMAMGSIGIPATWSWWVFVIIALGPYLAWSSFLWFVNWVLVSVPPKGRYHQYATDFEMRSSVLLKYTEHWRWSKEAKAYLQWKKNYERNI